MARACVFSSPPRRTFGRLAAFFFFGATAFTRMVPLSPGLILDAGERRQPVDQRVELLFGEVDLLRGTFDVEEAGPHGYRDLVQVADLREDLVGRLAQSVKAALLGERAAMALDQLVRREVLRKRECLILRAAGQRAAVGQAEIVPRLIGEPEAPHVLHAVEADAARHVVASAVAFDRRDMGLRDFVVGGHFHYYSWMQGAEEECGMLKPPTANAKTSSELRTASQAVQHTVHARSHPAVQTPHSAISRWIRSLPAGWDPGGRGRLWRDRARRGGRR